MYVSLLDFEKQETKRHRDRQTNRKKHPQLLLWLGGHFAVSCRTVLNCYTQSVLYKYVAVQSHDSRVSSSISHCNFFNLCVKRFLQSAFMLTSYLHQVFHLITSCFVTFPCLLLGLLSTINNNQRHTALVYSLNKDIKNKKWKIVFRASIEMGNRRKQDQCGCLKD